VSKSLKEIEDRHSRFELKTLLETSRMLIESHDMDFVMNNLLLIAMGKLMVPRGMILLYQPGSNNYLVTKAKGKIYPDEGTMISFEWDEKYKEQSVVRPEQEDLPLPDIYNEDKRCIFFNLQTSNHHLGYLCLGAKGTNKPLNEHEIEFIESLTIISSVAIANSRMFTELRRINRMLDRKVYELNTLFDLSKDFNRMVDREEIVRVFKFAMLGQMLIRKFFFVLEHDDKREMVAASGIKGSLKKKELTRLFKLEDDLVEVDEVLKETIPFLAHNQIKAVIGLKFQNEKIALVGVGAKANEESYSQSDYNFLQSLGNLALLSIQKTFLLEERIEKERLEEELTIAKSIQQGLLPDPIPEIKPLDISAVNISSYQVGGDYFDIQPTASERFVFAIGDVTGKGIPASLLMANLQSMLHILLPIDITLAEATGRLNDIIYENTPSDKFITFFWGLFDPDNYTFEYVNAGHNPPVWFKKDKEEPELLEEGGLILGAMSTMAPYEANTVSLSSGDLLVFFTDGVTEAMNPDETEEYGEERLLQCIKKNREHSAGDILDAVVEDINEFSEHKQYDDITLIVFKVK